MDSSASGEGASSASSAVKRGLSVDSGQEVKRFRTATGAISAVRKNQTLKLEPALTKQFSVIVSSYVEKTHRVEGYTFRKYFI